VRQTSLTALRSLTGLLVAPASALALLGATPAAHGATAAALRTRPAAHPKRHHPAKARKVKHRKAKRKPAGPPTSAVSVTQTTQDLSEALSPQPTLRFAPGAAAPGVPVIQVNDHATFQTFTGVGAAMTDTSAWLIWQRLAPAARAQLMRSLFSPSGAQLSFLRLPIGASDFSATGVPYTYDDRPPGQSDPTLAHFSIAHDLTSIIPALRIARALNPSLFLEGVPWSAPAWMKANDALDNLNHAGALLPTDYPVYARYFVKFLTAYAAHGVLVNAVTLQNEPTVPTQYPGMELGEAQRSDFVARDLKPALASAGLTPRVFGWDLSWGALSAADPEVGEAARGTLTGLAWHCYYGTPAYMTGVHAAAPHSMQIVDECTTGGGDTWATSELLISSLRNWANSVGLWNLALDPDGGPVEPPNSACESCTGVVTVNPQTGTYNLTRDYYELAQLSHFVEPGAVRINTPNFVSYNLDAKRQTTVTPGLDDVAFKNPNGSEALFLYNNAPTPITFAVAYDGSTVADTIPAQATTTLTWK
jgi:glucosylceramidase